MPKIIKDGHIIEDDWVYIDPPSSIGSSISSFTTFASLSRLPERVVSEQAVIISLDHWLSQRTQLLTRNKLMGIWLEGHADLSKIIDDLHVFGVIAINFSTFSDGRGFSLGNQLRERYQFQGELRAIGNLLPDQMYYLHRCGFNAVVMANPKDLNVAQNALMDFSHNYQEAWGGDKPIFRRR